MAPCRQRRLSATIAALTVLVLTVASIVLPGCASGSGKELSTASRLIALYYSHGVELPVECELEVQEDGKVRFLDSDGTTRRFRIGAEDLEWLRAEVASARFVAELQQQRTRPWADAAELEVQTAEVQAVLPCGSVGPVLRVVLSRIQAIVVAELGEVKKDLREIPCPM